MIDVALKFNNKFNEYDIDIFNEDLKVDNSLETAVIISLFTWARSGNPDCDSKLNYGWFGDKIDEENTSEIGSKLYLLKSNKITDETISQAHEYIKQALDWMIINKIVSDISIKVERNLTQNNRLDASVILRQHDDIQTIELKDFWKII